MRGKLICLLACLVLFRGTAPAAVRTPVFSFDYDGVSSAKLLRSWRYSGRELPSPRSGEKVYEHRWKDPRSSVEAICEEYSFSAFPDIREYVLRFRNGSKGRSGTISNVRTVDLSSAADPSCEIWWSDGSSDKASDFTVRHIALPAGGQWQLSASDGLPSQDVLPFFNVCGPDGGNVYAVGWTGDWQADFARSVQGDVRVSVGLKNFCSWLEPGEEIRTARVAVIPWKGDDRMEGQNRLRRFLMDCRSPKVDGATAPVPECTSFNFGDPAPFGEYTQMTSEWAVALIHRYRQFGLCAPVFWLDAGWYERASAWQDGYNWYRAAGNWKADAVRFPKGLSEVADTVHAAGSRFLLWFEPERVPSNSDWAHAHPEFMLTLSGIPAVPSEKYERNNFIVNLADPAALRWLQEEMVRMIREYKVDIYRQDFNIKIASYWASADAPGRRGITEVKYVEGLYAYWDYLLANVPGLQIDNCAAGGRRIDLETLSRAYPLCRSDWRGDHEADQAHNYRLSQWVPVHGNVLYDDDIYNCRSAYAPALIYAWKITDRSRDVRRMQALMHEYESVRDLYTKDFYPLAGDDGSGWVASQMDDPVEGRGIIAAFRQPDSNTPRIKPRIRALPQETYILTNLDTGVSFERSGYDLNEGLTISLPAARSSVIIEYKLKRQ